METCQKFDDQKFEEFLRSDYSPYLVEGDWKLKFPKSDHPLEGMTVNETTHYFRYCVPYFSKDERDDLYYFKTLKEMSDMDRVYFITALIFGGRDGMIYFCYQEIYLRVIFERLKRKFETEEDMLKSTTSAYKRSLRNYLLNLFDTERSGILLQYSFDHATSISTEEGEEFSIYDILESSTFKEPSQYAEAYEHLTMLHERMSESQIEYFKLMVQPNRKAVTIIASSSTEKGLVFKVDQSKVLEITVGGVERGFTELYSGDVVTFKFKKNAVCSGRKMPTSLSGRVVSHNFRQKTEVYSSTTMNELIEIAECITQEGEFYE